MSATKSTVKVRGTKKRAYRPFPYGRIARMWSAKKTIAQIARAIGRFDNQNPKRSLHAVRDCLRRMHKGYVDARGRLVKLAAPGFPGDCPCLPQGWVLGGLSRINSNTPPTPFQ